MKVAVSVPDPVFLEADQVARRLGLSRSELYSRAIATYVTKLRADDVTRALDRVYARESGDPEPVLEALQRRVLARETW